jgi:hypothetical protein
VVAHALAFSRDGSLSFAGEEVAMPVAAVTAVAVNGKQQQETEGPAYFNIPNFARAVRSIGGISNIRNHPLFSIP